ncbi:MAG: hypothetical protein PHG08_00025 [Bacilli bacterium]|nr:hypothetical protein [Bacilli bacterium]
MIYRKWGFVIYIKQTISVGYTYSLYLQNKLEGKTFILTEAGYRSEDIAFYAAVDKINELLGGQNGN